MTDPNVSRILKMLEDGKISASEAETLIAALREERASQGASGATAEPPRHAAHGARSTAHREEESPGRSKSFEFRWGQQKNWPFDLGGIGKQISDAVRKLDPERIIRDATANVAREARRFQERMRGWGGMPDEQEAPDNVHGYPVVSRSETTEFEHEPDMILSVENHYGDIVVTGGAAAITLVAVRQSWAPTEDEAEAALRDVRVEARALKATTAPPEPQAQPDLAPPPPPTVGERGARPRLEVRVTAPEEWRDGTVSLHLTVPSDVACRLSARFGEVKVSDVAGPVEANAVSADVCLESVGGPVRVQTVSGAIRAQGVEGHLDAATKSGCIQAERLSRGAVASTLSGDLSLVDVEGGRVEAKSISGDVRVERAGTRAPLDITIESVSGDVQLVDASGNIALKTVSGDAVAERVTASTMRSQAVSGDIRASFAGAFSGTMTATTVSGDVTIHLPEGSNLRFALDTQSGDLDVGLAVEHETQSDRLRTGTLGTGAGTITVHTLSGDVHLGGRLAEP